MTVFGTNTETTDTETHRQRDIRVVVCREEAGGRDNGCFSRRMGGEWLTAISCLYALWLFCLVGES